MAHDRTRNFERELDIQEGGVMTVHENSVVAYHQELDAFNEREKKIYGEIAFHGPMTDRECKDNLFGVMADMNTTRPRCFWKSGARRRLR